jgi:hypothetical protein
MNRKSNIIITSVLSSVALAVIALGMAAPVSAHGGFDHVMGTVVTVSNNVMTVKTAKGNVDVKLDDKTELTMNSQKAQVADLKPGARVVVDVPEGSKDNIAHSVKIGAAASAGQPAHDVHGAADSAGQHAHDAHK